MVSQSTINIFLIGIIGLIALVDLGANIINIVPFLGNLAETTSESLLELAQFLLTIFLVMNNND